MTDPEKKILGYCDPLSAAPGEKVRFMTSSYAPGRYRPEIVRVRNAGRDWGRIRGVEGLGVELEKVAEPVPGGIEGREQPVPIGSCAIVPACDALARLESFTVSAWVWPTMPGRAAQAIAGTWSAEPRAGLALFLDEAGRAGLLLGDGRGRVVRVVGRAPARARRWTLVCASYDAATGEVRLLVEALAGGGVADPAPEPERIVTRAAAGVVASRPGPFVVAAWVATESPRLRTAAHFDGRIEDVRLASAALDLFALGAAGVDARLAPQAADVVGAWDFSRDISSVRVRDLSPNRLDGETVNLPTRGVPGRKWSGGEHAWIHAPREYGAIHFHHDDLYDAAWEPDFEWRVPAGLRGGLYAARLVRDDGEDVVPFFVRPPRGGATGADVVFLVPTATYLAYANTTLHLRTWTIFGDPPQEPVPNDRLLLAHPELGLSQYDYHADGSGVTVSSRLRPIPMLKPDNLPWGYAADVQIARWLERSGRRFDVVTDEDLDAEGLRLLAPYRVVVTGSHPEYWSTAMLDALEGFLRRGGRLMYLGGNGFYWRIAFHREKPGAIEVRRAEGGTRAWIAEPGESYHAFTGEYGGLWRRIGRPPDRLVGVGFAAQGVDGGFYRRTEASRDPRAAFIFDGVGAETIGEGLAVGVASFEIDRCDAALGSPPHALVVARSEGHDRAQMLRTVEELHMATPPFEDPDVRADMTFFECPGGGAVFSTGAISWATGLPRNGFANDVAQISTNVLERFADPEPFVMPDGRKGGDRP